MNQILKKRWDSETARAFVQMLYRQGSSGNGYEVQEVPFGTLADTTRLDLRGMILAEGTDMRRITFRCADLTGAVFKRARFEGCVFSDVCFDDGSFQMLVEKGCSFEKCSFRNVSFRRAIIGYKGTRFTKCLFEKADFRQSDFIRPEFDECVFESCSFSGVDFNGASFEKCEFRGEVRGVWFRGSFPLRSLEERWGIPRPNRMNSVSFKNATLIDVAFSDLCDLSSATPPDDGYHALFDRWPERIGSVYDQSRSWPEPCRREAEMFYKSHEAHAKKQNWYIIGAVELMNQHGKEAGMKLWQALLSS